MRKKITALLSVLLMADLFGQTFNGNGGAITNNGVPTYFTTNVNVLPSQLDNNFGVVEVCLDITHPDMNEITVSLLSPFGVVVELVNSTSLSGGNFVGTCFNSTSGSSISGTGAPYSTTLKPTGYLGRFNIGKPGTGSWSLIVKDYFPNNNAGSLLGWTLKFGASPPQAVNLTSSNLPLVFLTTSNSQALTTSTMIAELGVVYNGGGRNNISDPRNSYNGKAIVNIRGSSSQIFEKKSIKLDLCNANGTLPLEASLAGMPSESDWVLSPGYSDKTLMRNALTHHLFTDMGHYSPRSRFVELFINGEYFGVYTLIEKPKRSADRVNISKLTDLDNAYPYITGGYILQINRRDDPGFESLLPGVSPNNAKFFYQYEYPKAEVITPQQKNYIKAVLDTFENVMNGPDFAHPTKGYRRYINVESFIDFMIINEFSKNVDGYKLSSFLYKDNIIDGGKIHMGPVWDYDIAWHNANYGNGDSELWWQYDQPDVQYPMPTWWKRLMEDPAFKDQMYCRWHTHRLNTINTGNINSYIDQNAGFLSEAQARNFQQFPILNTFIFPNPAGQIGSSYQGMVDDLKTWVAKRSTWLDQNIPGFCKNVSVNELAATENAFTSFPNPFLNAITVIYKTSSEAKINMQLLNVMGQKVLDTPVRTVSAGEHEDQLRTDGIEAGTYLLKLQVNDHVYYRKIIKSDNH